MIRKAIILGAALNFLTGGPGEAEASSLKAWIETNEVNGSLQLKSMVLTEHEVAVSYKLSVKRQAGAGVTQNNQAGTKQSLPGEPTLLSTSSVNLLNDGTLQATLEVRDEEGHVVTDTLELTAKSP